VVRDGYLDDYWKVASLHMDDVLASRAAYDARAT